MKKLLLLSVLFAGLVSCQMKTRGQLAQETPETVYARKNSENQLESQKPAAIDEKDELIRSLNGRVEVLENQLSTLNKEKETEAAAREQKLALFQEALTKMEAQIHELESKPAPVVEKKSEDLPSSDDLAKKGKKVSAYETAQDFFVKSEWKKAILSFQKYADEAPKGKNVPDAKYKIGVCFQELGMKEEAMAFFEEVVANYAATEAGKKSKSRLAKLKK